MKNNRKMYASCLKYFDYNKKDIVRLQLLVFLSLLSNILNTNISWYIEY